MTPRAAWPFRSNIMLVAGFCLTVVASATFAENDMEVTQPHLSVVPRTDDEIARIAKVTSPTSDFSIPEPFEANGGGGTTVRARNTTNAFSFVFANASFGRELQFNLDNGFFTKIWVSDGLGWFFNARSCQSCHIKVGRGHPPEPRRKLALGAKPAQHYLVVARVEGV